jgi:hypothetical protein
MELFCTVCSLYIDDSAAVGAEHQDPEAITK